MLKYEYEINVILANHEDCNKFLSVNHELYIRRCFELAVAGSGKVAPNPMVGAVIVHEGMIISEGYHTYFGGAHAEVEAIKAVSNKALLKDSTIYVSLEPCSHYGKTPPCVNLILESGIPEVVIACLDPNPKVSGSGIEKLVNAGVKVVSGILEDEAKELNKRFITSQLKQRPFILLKWAESKDGYMSPYATVNGKQAGYMISSDPSRVLVHKWRSEESSILVGAGTVISDDPALNVRFWKGKDPVPVILDPEGIIPSESRVLQHEKVIIYGPKRIDIKAEFIEVQKNIDPINSVLRHLYQRNIESVFVEGGAFTLNAFLDSQLWDEIRIIKSDSELEKGLPAPLVDQEPEVIFRSGNDTIYIYRNNKL